MRPRDWLTAGREFVYGLGLMLAVPAAVAALVAAVLLLEKVDDGRVDSPADHFATAVVFWLLLGYPLLMSVRRRTRRRSFRVQRGHTIVVFVYALGLIWLAYGLEALVEAL